MKLCAVLTRSLLPQSGGNFLEKMVYALTIVHGIMEQRASYGMLGWEDAFIEADLDLAKENLAIHMRRWEVLAHAREIQMIAETDGPTPEMPPAHLPT